MTLAIPSVEHECSLPRINEVFSKFSSVYSENFTRPLYMQVDTENGMGMFIFYSSFLTPWQSCRGPFSLAFFSMCMLGSVKPDSTEYQYFSATIEATAYLTLTTQ